MIDLTPEYMQGFIDGATQKRKEKEREMAVTFFAIKAAETLRRYCRERGPSCKGCPFSVDSKDTICVLHGDLPEDWKLEFMEGDEQCE